MKNIIMKTEKAIYEASYKEQRKIGGGYYNLYLISPDKFSNYIQFIDKFKCQDDMRHIIKSFEENTTFYFSHKDYSGSEKLI